MKKENQRLIHIRLSEKTHKKLRIRVAIEDCSIRDWVARLIESELGQKKHRG